MSLLKRSIATSIVIFFSCPTGVLSTIPYRSIYPLPTSTQIIQRKARHRKVEATLKYDHVSDDMVREYFEKQRKKLQTIEKEVLISADKVLWLPRRISDYDDTTIVMFLDEFQNTRLPNSNFDIVGYMQEAVESPTCPHFVTGSAMSILNMC